MKFRLLGALEVHDGAAEIKLVRRQERLLLAVLLLRANELAATEQLIDVLWPDDPPADARGALQVYVSRLRKAGIVIDGGRDGYAVRVPASSTDLGRFRGAVAAARALPDPTGRGSGLRAALELWRGELLPELVDQAIRDRLCVPVEEERRSALDERIQADLAAGLHADLLTELPALVEQDPTREITVAALMTALHRLGRRQDALDVYSAATVRLSDQFGLEPAPALRRLYAGILRNDPALTADLAAPDTTVPRELPVDISVLVGRDELVAEAVEILTRPDRDRAPVYHLWGGAGVGKSASGVRIAHRSAEAFPDGQLFARLQDVAGEPVPARALLGRMLRSLGLSSGEVPDGVDERRAVLRERTADLALLVVLDDALDAETVEYLLPQGPRSAAIVTSRAPLPELSTAVHRRVAGLDPEVSRGLLLRLIGRPVRDEDSINVVIDHSAGLPLALRIVGSRLALSGDDLLPELAESLGVEDQRLDSMVAGDLAVRTSLDRTVILVDAEARHLLERLSLVGVAEFPAWVAAPLLDTDESVGEAAFARLVDLGLVELVNRGRYKMHALVRSYAAERLEAPAEPLGRYLLSSLRLLVVADDGLGHGFTTAQAVLTPRETVLEQAEHDLAGNERQWLGESWQLLHAAATSAIAARRLEVATALGLRLFSFYTIADLREPRHELLLELQRVLRDAGELELLVRTEICLVAALGSANPESWPVAEESWQNAQRSGSVELKVRTLINLANSVRRQCDFDRDKELSELALDLIDHHDGPVIVRHVVLRNLGQNSVVRRDYPAAVEWFRQLLAEAAPGTVNEFFGQNTLSEILVKQGSLAEAEAALHRAREICAPMQSPYFDAQVDCLTAYLEIHRGNLDEAQRLLDQARGRLERVPVDIDMYLSEYGSELAMVRGDAATGRRIRLEMLATMEQRGDLLGAYQVRYELDNDPRDPHNRQV
ncbi:helix-turn-helix domain-containing protein [Kribbella antibiotica]|uniref:Helix-turn-helix domain-containing protein n=1 Tax=Kribbella antibiotica TaxID=190195 RepID=A0A4R4ZPY4_9ACTN|nr:AfsR/SARP family transcriptional regulator [Kribbella antibiotica]TDD60775.1 helix-turn-helix domain-containing protein [Kribbella antibiotica]